MIKLQSKVKWIEFRHPDGVPGNWYKWGDTHVCVSKDDGMWHMSISCPKRYPTWNEIYLAWYELVPGAGEDFNGAIVLPRKKEYVDLHPNCFHVYQHDAEIPGGMILL